MAKHRQIVPEIACAADLRDCRKPQIRIPEIPDEPLICHCNSLDDGLLGHEADGSAAEDTGRIRHID